MVDRSFKAVALRILKGIAKNVAGEGGGELTDLLGEAVGGLLCGDDDSLKGAIEGIDLDDEALTHPLERGKEDEGRRLLGQPQRLEAPE